MEEEEEVVVGNNNLEFSEAIAPAVIAVHPEEAFISVAVGRDLRVYNLRDSCPVDLQDNAEGPSHSDSIRAICFSTQGNYFASAGDDKLVKIWATESWQCIKTVSAEKRVTAITFTRNGSSLCFADKFGMVWVVEVEVSNMIELSVPKKATPILAHYCSIITSLELSSNGQFIASADRDSKIRVSVFPRRRPSKGAREIQSFCLGHTDFVSCLAYIQASDDSREFLLSGSGDSTVRLWDYEMGMLLYTCEVAVEAGLVGSGRDEDISNPAVTDLCVSSNGSVISVAMQSFHGVLLLSCDFDSRQIKVAKVVEMEKNFIPMSMRIGSLGHVWMVAGASRITLPEAFCDEKASVQSSPFACVKVIRVSDQNETTILEGDDVPGGKELLKKLQGKMIDEEDAAAFALAAEAANKAMCNLLIKRQYPAEKRELRKKTRNDKKQY